MLCITKAKYLENYKIEIAFNNSLGGVIDLENIVKTDHRKIFQQLVDKKNFSQVQLKFDTIAWKNGLDLAPEFLFDLLKQQTKQRQE
jgi:hypothetical protein